MSEAPPRRSRPPLSSLATKIIFVVFLATFLTAVVVSWISVHSTYTFLQRRLDQSYPAILEGAADRTVSWLEEARAELAPIAARMDSDAGAELEHWLRKSRRFDAAVLHDALGDPILEAHREGDAPLRGPRGVTGFWTRPGPDGVPRLGIGVAAGRDPDASQLVLHATLHTHALRPLLAADGLGTGGGLVLTDEKGHVLTSGRSDPNGPHAAVARIPLDAISHGEVTQFPGPRGQTMLGAFRPLAGMPLRLALTEPYEEAFKPVFAVVTRVFVVDLVILLAFGLLAYQITAAIVRPIEALSEGARRISQGDLDVELVETPRRDEIGLLTRTFNDMTRRLLSHRVEIEQTNQKLRMRNEELRRANEVLEQLSITDGLTKLHNHRFFQDHLTREIKRVARTDEPLSMMICDLDDFKRLNDRLGHAAGDELLVGIARILDESIRETDFLARYGGEEFVVLAPATDLQGAALLAEKTREAVAQASFLLDASNQLTKVTISVGVAQYEGSRKAFFQEADQALYRAKAAGKNCVRAAGDLGPEGPVEI